MSALGELLEKMKGPRVVLLGDFEDAFGIQARAEHALMAHHGSLNDASSLHDDLLPGCDWGRTESGIFYVCRDGQTIGYSTHRHNPARAWLIAILRAKLAEAK